MVPEAEAELVSDIKLCFIGEGERLVISSNWPAPILEARSCLWWKRQGQIPQSLSCPPLLAWLTLASCVRRTADPCLFPTAFLKSLNVHIRSH